jgi:hypothetical protein
MVPKVKGVSRLCCGYKENTSHAKEVLKRKMNVCKEDRGEE